MKLRHLIGANGSVTALARKHAYFGNPLYYKARYGLLLWLRADMGITLGGTLRGQGTAAPVWTISGTPTRLVGLHLEIDSVAGGTALGQATYKWSEDNGSTYVATGVLTAAGPSALGTTGLSVAMAAGPYNIDNKWDATLAGCADQSGLGNHAAQATPANQPVFSLAGFGGYAAWQTTGGAMGLVTPNLTIGVHTILFAMAGSNGAATGFFFGNVSPDNYMQNTLTPSSHVEKAAVVSRKEVTSTWLKDGVRKTAGRTFNGTHATHRVYVNGVDANATNGNLTADPGLATATAPFYVGTRAAGSGAPALYREIVVLSAAAPPQVMRALHLGMAARAPGAL
jgi:hypothetical protein